VHRPGCITDSAGCCPSLHHSIPSVGCISEVIAEEEIQKAIMAVTVKLIYFQYVMAPTITYSDVRCGVAEWPLYTPATHEGMASGQSGNPLAVSFCLLGLFDRHALLRTPVRHPAGDDNSILQLATGSPVFVARSAGLNPKSPKSRRRHKTTQAGAHPSFPSQ